MFGQMSAESALTELNDRLTAMHLQSGGLKDYRELQEIAEAGLASAIQDTQEKIQRQFSEALAGQQQQAIVQTGRFVRATWIYGNGVAVRSSDISAIVSAGDGIRFFGSEGELLAVMTCLESGAQEKMLRNIYTALGIGPGTIGG